MIQTFDDQADTTRQLRPPPVLPVPPTRLDDVDVPEHLLIDIALRNVYLRGTCTIKMLSSLMKLPPETAETLFRRLNEQQYFEVRRSSGDDFVFSLSAAGRRLAAERAATLRYAGPVPVSLRAWSSVVRGQIPDLGVTRETLREAFADIVVSDELLDALGPALISYRSIFLYGPSGTGKTSIAERLRRVFRDTVLVPYAVEVAGQIVVLADPAVHEKVALDQIGEGVDLDPRWTVCRRPFLSVGGELVSGMLDLQKDEATSTFTAPLQMKANNGFLLIDDFGRQLMSPRDLLNRWIVPLDRRVDFLSLSSGGKFDIPFELQVVFSTNIEPRELADDAFLRRVPNKIRVGAVDANAFDRIFHLAAGAAHMEFEPGIAEYCRELCLRHSQELLPCYPRDLCSAIRAIRLYERRKPAITRDDLERAARTYFV
jgi:DNA-binding MarR family transcriptional regulator